MTPDPGNHALIVRPGFGDSAHASCPAESGHRVGAGGRVSGARAAVIAARRLPERPR